MTTGSMSSAGVHRTVFAANPISLVFDSPHSGSVPPASFGAAQPPEILRQAEDSYVDELFAGAPTTGATLIAADFPRAFIDVNRASDDIDPALLDGPWPGALNPSVRSERGIGLIRRLVGPGQPIYDRLLPAAEIQARLDRHYRPYHENLEQTLAALKRRFGVVYHVNCHSMKSVGNATTPDGPARRCDIVIGDLHGTSCAPDFARLVVDAFASRGYSTAVNDPYAGAHILERYGDPSAETHSLQVEINRALYMDESTRQRHEGFETLCGDIAAVVADLAAEIVRRTGS